VKKFLFIIIFCVLSLKIEVFPAYAFSWSDIFPPIYMVKLPGRGQPGATEVKKIGPQGVSNYSYINGLDESYKCDGTVTVSNGWKAPDVPIKDDKGNIIGTEKRYPYDANNLNSEKLWTKLSNSFARFVNTQWKTRGIYSTNVDRIVTDFKDMGLTGHGFLNKIYSINQITCLQNQAIKEVFKSLDETDTDYSDLQLGWDKGGTFIELDDISSGCLPTTCRPVTIGEIAYFFYKNPTISPIFYTDCSTEKPEPWPENIADYSSLYKKTHKQYNVDNFLPGESGITAYKALYSKIPIKAQGPENQLVKITNYGSVASQWPNFVPATPTITKKNRPTWGLATGNETLTNQFSSVNSPNDFAPAFSCDDVEVITDSGAVDVPTPVGFIAYVKGLIRGGIKDEPSWAFSYGNPKVVINQKKVADAANTIDPNNLINFFSAGSAEAEIRYNELKNTPASSKSCEECPDDVGNKSDKMLRELRKSLYPVAWQDNYQGQM